MKKQEENKIVFDTNKILKKIVERDNSIHENIIKRVEDEIVEDIVLDIKSKYFTENWGEEKVKNYISDELEEEVDKIAKKILKDFYDSYRWKKNDIAILKELKKFIGED